PPSAAAAGSARAHAPDPRAGAARPTRAPRQPGRRDPRDVPRGAGGKDGLVGRRRRHERLHARGLSRRLGRLRSARDRRRARLGAIAMSHLHIPDGLLPFWLWGSGLLVALVLLVLSGRAANPQRVAYQGALGGLMLAANALPIGPLEYHLSLAGPIGILLGPLGAFQAAFAVSAILALLGHGGLTVVGLNTLVLGAGAAVARPVYGALARVMRVPWAMAWSTAAGQAVPG